MKLLTGSHGSLAIVAEATFKVRPRPTAERCCVIRVGRIDTAVALGLKFLSAQVQPAYVEGLNTAAGRAIGLRGASLLIGLHGLEAEIEAQRRELDAIAGMDAVEDLPAPAAVDVLRCLRDLPAAEHAFGCRIATLPSRLAETLSRIEDAAQTRKIEVSMLARAGNGSAVLRIAADRLSDAVLADFAAWMESQVSATEGCSVIFDGLPKQLKDDIDPWGTERSLTAAQLSLMRAVKSALDPRSLLSPGRFVGGL
jgi:glycolate oxidase FAD binding subunit